MVSGDVTGEADWTGGVRSARASAWRATQRHSRRVRFLRIALPAITAVIALGMFVSLRGLPTPIGDLSLGEIGVSGSTLTMEKPHLTGYGSGGMSYDVTAARALQELGSPNVVRLETISGRVQQPGDRWTTLDARNGVYDSDAETLKLENDIRIVAHDGKRAFLEAADVDLKKQTVESDRPVRLEMPGARVRADSMSVSAGGEQVNFRGGVIMDIRLDGGAVGEEPDS